MGEILASLVMVVYKRMLWISSDMTTGNSSGRDREKVGEKEGGSKSWLWLEYLAHVTSGHYCSK